MQVASITIDVFLARQKRAALPNQIGFSCENAAAIKKTRYSIDAFYLFLYNSNMLSRT